MPSSTDPIVAEFIAAGARRRGLDPRAVAAVALGEGGLRRGAIGDAGTSGGPFQLHRGGALPANKPVSWASTDEGINYALDRIAGVARGLRGPRAVEAIVRRFERPADPDTSVRNAIGRLGSEIAAAPAVRAQAPARITNELRAAPVDTGPDRRRQFASELIGATRNAGGLDTRELLSAVLARRAPDPVPAQLAAPAAASRPVAPTLPGQPPAASTGPKHAQPGGGLNQGFQQKLDALVAASGGKLKVTSGYRTPEHQAELYAAALKKYGSEQEARRWVAPPGKSNHNKGIAADLGGDLAWAKANAARFGLQFPLSNEAWHVEPVGSRG